MRHIVGTNEVPHLWAHQSQDWAKNKQKNLFFENKTIYSYGHHFPIARHVVNSAGDKAILFTTHRYSVTTSQHISSVRSAIPDSVLIIPTCNVERTPDNSILDALQSEIDELALKAKRSRKYAELYRSDIVDTVNTFNAVAKFISSERKAKEPSAKELDAKAKEQRQQAKEARIIAEQRRAERRAKYANDIEAWKQGENVYVPSNVLNGELMRIVGDEIETTRGATVPVEHVKRIAPMIVKLISEGKTYQRNGHSIHVGPYVIEELDANGSLHVGCHIFEKDEILRIAALLGETI